ncbi:peptidase inhibitor family I36 protein [Saccharopolyspora sp. TS4A08]|uniref:Peptidase inhibitor family I36 protein n=1 Tax=Saccharopolyspora ipomoeae TaxID=3042027 RepID=A0ABT6PNR9_9PSEU|nr:peptidase inhibitor family I36 protein [Saccharopolyspora sp. TS4A08]MDI2029608.1 peptidase inhibitor family I36 protein [Saccharopolyspora sp. TS4A08]
MSTRTRKIAASGAGALLLMAVGGGVASGETQEEAVQRAKAVCGEGQLCVWDGPNFSGHQNTFHDCLDAWAKFEGFEDGRAGSWLNTQYAPGVASFATGNPDDPATWTEGYRSPENEAIADGGPLNLVGVDPC